MDTFRARYCSDPQSRRKWAVYGGAAATVTVVLIIIIAVVASGGNDGPEFRGSSVLNDVPLIEGSNFLPSRIDRHNLAKYDFSASVEGQTNLAKLKIGKVGALFFVASAECNSSYLDAVQQTLDEIDLIKRLIEVNKDNLRLVTDSRGIQEAFDDKKIACLIGVDGGHSIDSRHSALRMFYSLGVRYLTITQSGCDTPWADSNKQNDNKEPEKIKLTDWGKEVIQEMNRLGMIIDLSGASTDVIDSVLTTSKAPVIFSHSASYDVFEHAWNIKKETLEKLKTNDGLIMVNFDPTVLSSNTSTTSIADAVQHLNAIKDVVGNRHIGIGGSFDSTEKHTKDLEDVSKYPTLFDRLGSGENISNSMQLKWNRDDLVFLASENFIRVFEKVEQYSKGNNLKTQESAISIDDLLNRSGTLACRSDYLPVPEVTTTTTTATVPTTPPTQTTLEVTPPTETTQETEAATEATVATEATTEEEAARVLSQENMIFEFL